MPGGMLSLRHCPVPSLLFPLRPTARSSLGIRFAFLSQGGFWQQLFWDRGHAVWEDQPLPIVFLGAANDHGYSNPKIRKGGNCYPLSEIVPHQRGKLEHGYVLHTRWPELGSRGRNTSKLLKSPKLNHHYPVQGYF